MWHKLIFTFWIQASVETSSCCGDELEESYTINQQYRETHLILPTTRSDTSVWIEIWM